MTGAFAGSTPISARAFCRSIMIRDTPRHVNDNLTDVCWAQTENAYEGAKVTECHLDVRESPQINHLQVPLHSSIDWCEEPFELTGGCWTHVISCPPTSGGLSVGPENPVCLLNGHRRLHRWQLDCPFDAMKNEPHCLLQSCQIPIFQVTFLLGDGFFAIHMPSSFWLREV